MPRETNRTNSSDKTRVTPLRERLYDERHRLTPTTSVWAAVPLPVLRLLQHEDVDRAVRVLCYLIEHSWAMLIPPANYRGDGQDREDWRPSTYAVKTPQKPGAKARSPFWALHYIRSRDIADDLGIHETNVSKELKWLGDRGAIRTDPKGHPIFPIQVLDVPAGLSRKNLSESTSSDFQHPYFQQLFDFKLRIEAEYEEAKRKALAPVMEAYRPAFEKVNTQERELKKAAKKARRQGVDLSQLVKVDKFPELTPIDSVQESPKPAPSEPTGTDPRLVKVDKSRPLSPINRLVNSDKFLGRIKNIGRDTHIENNNNTPAAPETGGSVVVALVLAALQEHGTTTEAAARKLVAQCQAARPGCTAEEIVSTMRGIAAGFSRSVKNPVGVLLTQVPRAIRTAAPTRKPPQPTTDGELAAIRSLLNDPNEPEEHKALYRERLADLEQQPA